MTREEEWTKSQLGRFDVRVLAASGKEIAQCKDAEDADRIIADHRDAARFRVALEQIAGLTSGRHSIESAERIARKALTEDQP